MLSVDEALQRILRAFAPLAAETVRIEQAMGRTLAEDVHARTAQPPFPVSAMDGYAVRAGDDGPRRVIGSAPAGHPFDGVVGPGEAVRIFTGAAVPDGADTIALQENAVRDGDRVLFSEPLRNGRFIRAAGLDFAAGEILARAGHVLTARDLALLAAGDLAHVSVRRRPHIAFAATGDELSRPGEPRKPGGIVASSAVGLAALIEQWGGEPHDLGILPDRLDAIADLAERAADADLLVTLGGASVGEHDLVYRALEPKGFALDFWKIAMRPGKPLLFGRLGEIALMGLPGNPVSTLVCSLLFVKPAIAAMLGREGTARPQIARLDGALPPNDGRQDYLRATMHWHEGAIWVAPHAMQDSSMLKLLAASEALIVRAPHAPAVAHGAMVEAMLL
jgi:molybdopterin molybdotransferase